MNRVAYFITGVICGIINYCICTFADVGYWWSLTIAGVGLVGIACFWFAAWGYEYE